MAPPRLPVYTGSCPEHFLFLCCNDPSETIGLEDGKVSVEVAAAIVRGDRHDPIADFVIVTEGETDNRFSPFILGAELAVFILRNVKDSQFWRCRNDLLDRHWFPYITESISYLFRYCAEK